MYDNIGGKIKGLATFIFLLGAIAAISSGIILMIFNADTEGILIGLLIAIVGTLVAWISLGYSMDPENLSIKLAKL